MGETSGSCASIWLVFLFVLERMRAARDDCIYAASIRGGCCCLLSRVRECVRMASAVNAALVYTASTPAAVAATICQAPGAKISPFHIHRVQQRRGSDGARLVSLPATTNARVRCLKSSAQLTKTVETTRMQQQQR